MPRIDLPNELDPRRRAPTPVSVRLPTPLRDRIDLLRLDERRSLNAQIIVLLEEALQQRGAELELAPPDDPAGANGAPTPRSRPRPCPHRTPKGAYCKRCQRVIE